ncbi:MAG: SRPBCC family protein [Pyrinomonadaceae bacterium]|nr:SRPBCC family protein [Acidobacteriota bacterium]MBK7932695.1 SRPBCC family protein [Acidobacteriota bacterium]MBP7375093.1 SRPBCC family protein [Pyrinomonadaceae bacterium]MBP7476480.1 SRPBCC family protein [Pyrinomonadaceae bacterium]
MIKKVILAALAGIALAIAAFCVVVALQPEDFKIERSATINAAPGRVFEQVNDFRKWEDWSPWAKLDPEMKPTYAGPASGVGSSYSWVGNDDVGEGKMTITQSHPNEHIAIELEFIKPFAAKNLTEFVLKPEGSATNVTWTMTGKNNYVMKAFSLVMNMDKLVGADFEKGLAQMKIVVEGPKQPL